MFSRAIFLLTICAALNACSNSFWREQFGDGIDGDSDDNTIYFNSTRDIKTISQGSDLSLTVIPPSGFVEGSNIKYSVSSDNTGLIPKSAVSFEAVSGSGVLNFFKSSRRFDSQFKTGQEFVMTVTPVENQFGTANILLIAEGPGLEGMTLRLIKQIRVIVTPSSQDNLAPSFTSMANLQTFDDGDYAVFPVELMFGAATDASDPNGDSLRYRIVTIEEGSILINGNAAVAGTSSFGAEDTVVLAHSLEDGVHAVMTIVATDGTLESPTPVSVSAIIGYECVEDATLSNQAGQGSEIRPYLICTEAQLNHLAAQGSSTASPHPWDQHYMMTASIALTADMTQTIGNTTKPFGGFFDGDDYQINNFRNNLTGERSALLVSQRLPRAR
jgi:hypothetical protein